MSRRARTPEVVALEDDPLWYKDADHLRGPRPRVHRQQRRRHRRLPRPDSRSSTTCRTSASPPSGCCRSTRRRCATTATTSPTTPRVHPIYGTLDDFQALSRGGAPPRPARHHRAGPQPHVRPAPVVPARPPRPPGSPERDFYVWSDTAERYHGRPHHLQGLRALELDLGPGRQGLLLAPLLLASARSQLRQPRRPGGHPRGRRLLARHGRRRDAARRRALPLRARGHQLREPAGDARLPQGAAARTSTSSIPNRMLLAEANQWPEDAVAYFGDGDECHMAFHFPLMPRMFMAIQHGGPLPDRRHPRTRRRPSPTTASGRSSCATTTS